MSWRPSSSRAHLVSPRRLGAGGRPSWGRQVKTCKACYEQGKNQFSPPVLQRLESLSSPGAKPPAGRQGGGRDDGQRVLGLVEGALPDPSATAPKPSSCLPSFLLCVLPSSELGERQALMSPCLLGHGSLLLRPALRTATGLLKPPPTSGRLAPPCPAQVLSRRRRLASGG